MSTKAILYVLMLIFFVSNAYAIDKKKVAISPVSRNYFGLSSDLVFKCLAKKNTYFFGHGYLLNANKKTSTPNDIFADKGHATSLLERFSLKFGYERVLFGDYPKNVSVHFFSEFVLSRTSLKVEYYEPALSNDSYKSDPFIVYESTGIDNVKTTFINVNTGFGFEVPILSKISLQSRAGVPIGIVIRKVFIGGPNKISGASISHMFYSFTLNYTL